MSARLAALWIRLTALAERALGAPLQRVSGMSIALTLSLHERVLCCANATLLERQAGLSGVGVQTPDSQTPERG